MGNIVTYAEKYFDKDFKNKSLTEVDSLILCNLAYYPFEGSDFEKSGFEKSVREFLEERPESLLKGLVSVKEDRKLRKILEQGGRHGNLKASDFVGILEVEKEKQFSAITFDLEDGTYYISFRGTDNTLTGWREDFNLSFTKDIPAQEEAAAYVKREMDRLTGEFYLGGHSKGGNLAVYCAAMLPEKYQSRILEVYNHDGPGFLKGFYENTDYKNIRSHIKKTVPESSIIGMLLEEDDHYQVIKSTENGLMQHDPFSWVVEDDQFVRVDKVDDLSYYTSRALRRWLEQFDLSERERIVDTVFDVIAGMGIHELEELADEKRKRIKLFVESIGEVDREDRKLVFHAIGNLFSLSMEEIQQAMKIESKEYIEKYIHDHIEKHIPEQLQSFISGMKKNEDKQEDRDECLN